MVVGRLLGWARRGVGGKRPPGRAARADGGSHGGWAREGGGGRGGSDAELGLDVHGGQPVHGMPRLAAVVLAKHVRVHLQDVLPFLAPAVEAAHLGEELARALARGEAPPEPLYGDGGVVLLAAEPEERRLGRVDDRVEVREVSHLLKDLPLVRCVAPRREAAEVALDGARRGLPLAQRRVEDWGHALQGVGGAREALDARAVGVSHDVDLARRVAAPHSLDEDGRGDALLRRGVHGARRLLRRAPGGPRGVQPVLSLLLAVREAAGLLASHARLHDRCGFALGRHIGREALPGLVVHGEDALRLVQRVLALLLVLLHVALERGAHVLCSLVGARVVRHFVRCLRLPLALLLDEGGGGALVLGAQELEEVEGALVMGGLDALELLELRLGGEEEDASVHERHVLKLEEERLGAVDALEVAVDGSQGELVADAHVREDGHHVLGRRLALLGSGALVARAPARRSARGPGSPLRLEEAGELGPRCEEEGGGVHDDARRLLVLGRDGRGEVGARAAGARATRGLDRVRVEDEIVSRLEVLEHGARVVGEGAPFGGAREGFELRLRGHEEERGAQTRGQLLPAPQRRHPLHPARPAPAGRLREVPAQGQVAHNGVRVRRHGGQLVQARQLLLRGEEEDPRVRVHLALELGRELLHPLVERPVHRRAHGTHHLVPRGHLLHRGPRGGVRVPRLLEEDHLLLGGEEEDGGVQREVRQVLLVLGHERLHSLQPRLPARTATRARERVPGLEALEDGEHLGVGLGGVGLEVVELLHSSVEHRGDVAIDTVVGVELCHERLDAPEAVGAA
mmetsp:Transcript_10024/g.29507  ORF Transcript_10024/g.29507 Transcript_10024/m.29507 type:complete len:801 (-) Transcript_10024:367-2769(-)